MREEHYRVLDGTNYSLYFSDLSDIQKSTTFLCSFCAAETPLAASPVVSHFAALAKEDLIGRRDTCDLLRDVVLQRVNI